MILDDIGDNEYKELGDFEKVPDKLDYLHLIGVYKRHLSTCIRLQTYVLKHYPGYYRKMEEVLGSTTSLSAAGYDYSHEDNSALINEYYAILTNDNKPPITAVTRGKDRRLLARDLFMEGKGVGFLKLRETGQRFKIISTTDFEIIESNKDDGDEIKASIVVEEFNGQNITEELILLDQIIFNEVVDGFDSETFANTALGYLSDDFPESEKANFLDTLWERIFHFIAMKVFVAVAYDVEE